jgi:hypothetical protein
MAEHDQRFKVLLKEFFAEFLLLFFPQWAARFDLDHIEWLDKEFFTDPPQGEALVVDLVAKLRLRAAEAGEVLALIHVEIESRDSVEALRRRMFEYYHPLRRDHKCPVLPIGVYLRVGLDGIGVDGYAEDFEDLDVLRFRYLYVGLPALDAEQYLQGSNWLGVGLSALMKAPRFRRAWLRSEALRRLVVEYKESPKRQELLLECVEAYTELDEEQQRVYEELLKTERYKEVPPMLTTTLEKGKAQGRREFLHSLLEHRFGKLSAVAQQRLADSPADRLEDIARGVLDGKSLQELGLEG